MARLQWNQSGQRLYEAGVDRGVLYLNDDTGIPWDGLVQIVEDSGDTEHEPLYFDGVKYNSPQAVGDFEGTLDAFTYPDEFLEYEGFVSLGEGLLVDDQPAKQFGLSFRTMVGNDVEGSALGYKLHLIYNLVAVPADITKQTLTEQFSLSPFSWRLTAVPEQIPGFRPTAHVILDSRFLSPEILTEVENILYGTEGFATGDIIYDGGPPEDIDREEIDGGGPGSFGIELPGSVTVEVGDPRLPPISELIDLIGFYGPKKIIPDTIGGLADLINDPIGDVTQTDETGIFSMLADTRLIETGAEGFYEILP